MSTATPAHAHPSRLDSTPVSRVTDLMERNLLPDWLIRIGIRRLLAQRLREEDRGGIAQQQTALSEFVRQLKSSPIALSTNEANQQHYEVPARFFQLVLGKNLKYSSGLWEAGCSTVDAGEEAMLKRTVERARLANNQDILELGCGWGSLTLYMAANFPGSRITAVSNSHSQREFIESQARARSLTNIRILTADMNAFAAPGLYDRVVSVEMFEHMRNYELLLSRIAAWMRPEALLFVHIFTHKRFSYPFEVKDSSDWMAKFFFTGGIMPGNDLLLYFQRDLSIAEHWQHSGRHYSRTSRAWLDRMDANLPEITRLFSETYASTLPPAQRKLETQRWIVRWRVFFMACEELWGFRNGEEWGVSHYVFNKPSP